MNTDVNTGVKKDKRSTVPPIPENLTEILTHLQLVTLRQIENFGWRLLFVRRPLFQTPIPVVLDPETRHLAVIAEDGVLDTKPAIQIRAAA